MATKNPCGKSVKKENPYEVWTEGGDFTWLVLKKYQTPEKEAINPNAAWFFATRGSGTHGSWELGDGYVRDMKRGGGYKLTTEQANTFLQKEFGAKAGLTVLDKTPEQV